jgi:hypothetical protein
MSSLETSVTLEDVFTVVEAKRVPLAPELAGYLALEIADGTDAGGGDVDPKTVFVSEEGTVALVRPKKDAVTGNAEASVRRLLTKLLEASGSGTPALSAAAKRKPGNGLPALVEELEAALIPVNRSAGRRALARLAREVKRVLLGVGRNASVPPVVSREPVKSVAPHPRPVLRKKEESAPRYATRAQVSERPAVASADAGPVVLAAPFEEENATAKRTNELSALASSMNAVDMDAAAKTPPPPPGASPPTLTPPPPPKREPTPAPAAAEQRLVVEPTATPPPAVPSRDDVDSLLESFAVSSAQEDRQMARELKAIAGLSPTPPPPDAKTLAELTKDVGAGLPELERSAEAEGDGVEALLALTDPSGPVPGSVSNVDEPAPPSASAASANLPASPGLGPSSAGSVAAAPAALRQSAPALPRYEASGEKDPKPPSTAAPGVSSSQRAKADTPPSVSPSKRGRTDTRPRAPKTGMAMLVFALLVLAGGTVAIWKFAPHVFTGKKKTAPPAAMSAVPVAPPPKCKVALVLTDVPANAEILLRMGQAPLDVERMPVGTRLELVATAEGYAPRRAVIKADSPWDTGPDGKPRIEIPIQLDPSKAKPNAPDPWPAAEPGSQVGGSGAPGTVHVVSNVRGAEVWLLAGLGPEARIDQLRCDADIDVLLAGPPTLRKRLHVAEKEIGAVPADNQGNKVVSLAGK